MNRNAFVTSAVCLFFASPTLYGANDELKKAPLVLHYSDLKIKPSVLGFPSPAVPDVPAVAIRIKGVVTSSHVVDNSPSVNNENDRAEFTVKRGAGLVGADKAQFDKIVLWSDTHCTGFRFVVGDEWVFELSEKGEFVALVRVQPAPKR